MRLRASESLLLLLGLSLAACSSSTTSLDAEPATDASARPDAHAADAALASDATPADLGQTDAGQSDTGPALDALVQDDAQPLDSSLTDAVFTDAVFTDAVADDAAASDAAAPDALPADAGSYNPAPNQNTPGAHTATSCPQAGVGGFQQSFANTTFHTFTGTVGNNLGNGQFYVVSTSGQQLFGVIPTNGGSYSVTVPLFCGQQLVKLSFGNASCSAVYVIAVDVQGCTNPDIRLTVQWDDVGRDWELHLIKPGGHINDNATDCTWTSCINSSPDWGVVGDATDNPHKDVDNTGLYGPENITLLHPETGRFTVMVEHWGSGGPTSSGNVIINLSNGGTTVVPINDLIAHWVASPATIDWPTGSVRTSTAQLDCTANWSGGCRLSIP